MLSTANDARYHQLLSRRSVDHRETAGYQAGSGSARQNRTGAPAEYDANVFHWMIFPATSSEDQSKA